MSNNNFNCSISANISAGEAIKKISNITDWWGVTLTGNTVKQGDEFVIRMTGDSYFNCIVEHIIASTKVVWLVTDCHMPWYANKKEWANTRLVFDLNEQNGVTGITFTHEGLTPDIECYNDCCPGWTHWITKSLFSYLTTGKGVFKEPSK